MIINLLIWAAYVLWAWVLGNMSLTIGWIIPIVLFTEVGVIAGLAAVAGAELFAGAMAVFFWRNQEDGLGDDYARRLERRRLRKEWPTLSPEERQARQFREFTDLLRWPGSGLGAEVEASQAQVAARGGDWVDLWDEILGPEITRACLTRAEREELEASRGRPIGSPPPGAEEPDK